MDREESSNTKRSSARANKHPHIKPVAILNVKEHTPSPHLLDLKKIHIPKRESILTPAWQPNVLHEFLAHPIAIFKESESSRAALHTMPIFETKRNSFQLAKHLRALKKQIQNDTLAVTCTIRQTISLSARVLLYPLKKTRDLARSASLHTGETSLQLRKQTHNLHSKIRKIITPKKYVWDSVWLKTASAFAATALLLIIPVKVFSAYSNLKENRTAIQEQGSSAFQSLKASGNMLLTIENNDAMGNIQNALALFSKANGELAEVGPITRTLLRLSPSRYAQFETGSHILRAGELISRALLPLTTSLGALKNTTASPLTDRLLTSQKAIKEALPLITDANMELRGIKSDALPVEYREQFQTIRGYLHDLESDMQTADPLFGVLYEMLGGTTDKRYLVALQNNTEMRATGGFIGSFALLDMSQGEIKQIRFPNGGSYDLQGNLKVALEPPAPLKILRTRWEFQDANWFPDFPASARKLAWFYEKSGGATVDGVIAFDTRVLIDLLKLTGHITIPSFNKTISANNAILTIQTEVETNYDRQINEPKRFLGEVIKEIIKKVKTDPSNGLFVLSLLQNNLATRHIQLMSFNDTEQKSITDHDWGGALKSNTGGDYLAIINSNIGGQKTDGVIKQKAHLQTKVQDDGSVINTLTIERTHMGVSGELFYGAPNIDYVRVLVPEGSILINTTGFSYPEESMVKISDEKYATDQDLARIETNQKIDEASGTVVNSQFDKTAFANWIITKPGETSIATMTYRLPFNVFSSSEKSFLARLNTLFGNADEQLIKYSLLVQKQAGMEENNFTHRVALPAPSDAVWMTPSDWSAPNDRSYETQMKSDGDIFNGFVGRLTKKS